MSSWTRSCTWDRIIPSQLCPLHYQLPQLLLLLWCQPCAQDVFSENAVCDTTELGSPALILSNTPSLKLSTAYSMRSAILCLSLNTCTCCLSIITNIIINIIVINNIVLNTTKPVWPRSQTCHIITSISVAGNAVETRSTLGSERRFLAKKEHQDQEQYCWGWCQVLFHHLKQYSS